jgi:hypothetical protein
VDVRIGPCDLPVPELLRLFESLPRADASTIPED